MNTPQQPTLETDLTQALSTAVKRIESELYMRHRRHLLSELAAIEDRLIENGDLRYRTKPPNHRKED